MEKFNDLTEKDFKEFFSWLLEKDIELKKELDYTLCASAEEPYVYYPEQMAEFIQTRPMQRLKRIEQLGTSVLNNVDACHTRYSHCLGTYNNAVIFYLYQYRNPEWKTRIEAEDRKIEVLADIMEALRHDDGHNILSHGLERLIGQAKGTHEVVGGRFKDELPETIAALDKIHPKLRETMKRVSRDDYDLITLREGNLDFDRLDFVSRDSLYLGLPEKRSLSHELLKRSNVVHFPTTSTPREMVIYDYEALPFIEAFIETRADLYKRFVSSNERKSLDILEEEFCRIFLDSNISGGKRLRKYLEHCQGSSATTIDLEEFLSWNDLKYYNELIDIALTSEDDNIQRIASACLPSKEGLCSLAIEILNPKNTDPATYTDEDRLFLQNIRDILKKDHPLHDRLEEQNVRACLRILNATQQSEVESVLQSLRRQGLTSQDLAGITTWDETVKKYNFNETIFVRDKNGNVFPLQHHPELSIDLSPIHISGALFIPSKLRRLGVPEEKIDLIQREFETFGVEHPIGNQEYKRTMRKFKQGEEIKVPEYRGEKERND